MGEKARLKVIGRKAHGLDKLGELKEQGGRYRVPEDLGLKGPKFPPLQRPVVEAVLEGVPTSSRQ